MSSIKNNGKGLSKDTYLSAVSNFNQLIKSVAENNNSSGIDYSRVEEHELAKKFHENINLFVDDKISVFPELPKSTITIMEFNELVKKLDMMELSFKENDCIIISDVDLAAQKNNGNENKSGIPFKHK